MEKDYEFLGGNWGRLRGKLECGSAQPSLFSIFFKFSLRLIDYASSILSIFHFFQNLKIPPRGPGEGPGILWGVGIYVS